jgi:hypothetical protein
MGMAGPGVKEGRSTAFGHRWFRDVQIQIVRIGKNMEAGELGYVLNGYTLEKVAQEAIQTLFPTWDTGLPITTL